MFPEQKKVYWRTNQVKKSFFLSYFIFLNTNYPKILFLEEWRNFEIEQMWYQIEYEEKKAYF